MEDSLPFRVTVTGQIAVGNAVRTRTISMVVVDVVYNNQGSQAPGRGRTDAQAFAAQDYDYVGWEIDTRNYAVFNVNGTDFRYHTLPRLRMAEAEFEMLLARATTNNAY